MFYRTDSLSNVGAKFTIGVKYMIFDWDDILDYSLEHFAGHTLQMTLQITAMIASVGVNAGRRIGVGEDREPPATVYPCDGCFSRIAVHQMFAKSRVGLNDIRRLDDATVILQCRLLHCSRVMMQQGEPEKKSSLSADVGSHWSIAAVM